MSTLAKIGRFLVKPVVEESRYGKGWFLNPENERLIGMQPSSLGPHGDHDGWISVAQNARELGIDPREAKAFQRGSYGFYLPRGLTQQVQEEMPGALIDETRGRGLYSPMMTGERHEGVEDMFNRLYGTDTESAALSGMPPSLADLIRIRKWKGDGNFTYNPTGELDDDKVRMMSDTVDALPEIFGAPRVSVYGDDVGRYVMKPEEFANLKSLRDLKKYKDGYAQGGLVQYAKSCGCS